MSQWAPLRLPLSPPEAASAVVGLCPGHRPAPLQAIRCHRACHSMGCAATGPCPIRRRGPRRRPMLPRALAGPGPDCHRCATASTSGPRPPPPSYAPSWTSVLGTATGYRLVSHHHRPAQQTAAGEAHPRAHDPVDLAGAPLCTMLRCAASYGRRGKKTGPRPFAAAVARTQGS